MDIKDKAAHLQQGQKGENIAADYLTKNGFTLRERNWRFGQYEVDLIAEKNNTLHIVEVKTRKSGYIEAPYMAVNRNKQQFLIKAANAYVNQKNIHFDVQFDIISIVMNPFDVEYIPEAFYPRW